MGQCHLPKRSQCYQCGVAEKGSVPVCAADRHPLLTPTPRPAESRGQGGRQTLSPYCGGSGGTGPKEWSNTLLESGETQVCGCNYRCNKLRCVGVITGTTNSGVWV